METHLRCDGIVEVVKSNARELRVNILLAQEALLAMDAAALSVEQLDALSRAVPDDSERRDIKLYLQVRTCPKPRLSPANRPL